MTTIPTGHTVSVEYLLSEYFYHDLQTDEDNGRTRDPYEKNWVNPHNRSTIKPYVPSDSRELVQLCQDAYTTYSKSLNFNTGTLIYELRDPFVIILAHLRPKSLANFAEVSKCCYLATKPSAIWESQLCKLLPNVKFLPTELCQFSSEQQFKIIFKRMNDELKPYISKQKRNYEILNELRGPNGMNGTIDAAWKDLEQKGGPREAIKWWNAIDYPPLSTEELAAHEAYKKYRALDYRRTNLAGESYDGTVDSMDPDSEIARLHKTIEFDVPNAFNDQDRIENIIRSSEAQTNFQNLTDDSTEDAINSAADSVKDSNPPDSSCSS